VNEHTQGDAAPPANGEPAPLTRVGDVADVGFDERGLVPVVVVDAGDGAVLMLAYADREALEHTLATGQAHYHSRSRGTLWRKGATSGNVQRVVDIVRDCDSDALLYRVHQTGPACHTGERSCFHSPLARSGGVEAEARGQEKLSVGAVMELLERVVSDRLSTLPQGSYVRRLHERGVGYVAQKVIEEAGETIVAALELKDKELTGETADLLFHLSVLLAERGVTWDEVAEVLLARHRTGHEPRA
jgi:phosphoribosyl-ATP pyrophosphohydrolase/phosphoribosyl-AMP cyclohydrolase